MTFYFLFYTVPFLSEFPLSFPLHRPIFILIILLEHKSLPVYDAFNSFSYPGFVIGEHFYSFFVELYTLHRIQHIRTVTHLAH